MRRRMSRWTDFSVRSKATSSKDVSLVSAGVRVLALYLLSFYFEMLEQPRVLFRGRVKTHVPMLQVWTAEKPHPQEEVRHVWFIVQHCAHVTVFHLLILTSNPPPPLVWPSLSTWTACGPRFRS